ncbi:MAG TPA: hypothetical protein VK541_20415 [Pedobacter sp.]|uniref:hypothetical protein n=1 Tax=Pedobacter sp. TaxID=1411316 RepID=UPI002C462691|nr:hypothetical protein [Pedobacter sp.]HMI04864.1 hypothetical protein [Pedobacter sp.]
MTWINFFTFCGIGYAVYYLMVFLLDSRAAPEGGGDIPTVLTFSEDVVPEKISLADFGAKADASVEAKFEPASVGMGGVSIKELFVLAQKDAIQYTRSVSF